MKNALGNSMYFTAESCPSDSQVSHGNDMVQTICFSTYLLMDKMCLLHVLDITRQNRVISSICVAVFI